MSQHHSILIYEKVHPAQPKPKSQSLKLVAALTTLASKASRSRRGESGQGCGIGGLGNMSDWEEIKYHGRGGTTAFFFLSIYCRYSIAN